MHPREGLFSLIKLVCMQVLLVLEISQELLIARACYDSSMKFLCGFFVLETININYTAVIVSFKMA